ncbi:MAG: hypothetical protein K0U98_24440 [Deltaproteobacteria bacterium]|nr:hypothetical protein [Deltaproteobacteria bacterium]
MKIKSNCCKKFKRKAKACKGCPLFAELSKKQRKKAITKARRKLGCAA